MSYQAVTSHIMKDDGNTLTSHGRSKSRRQTDAVQLYLRTNATDGKESISWPKGPNNNMMNRKKKKKTEIDTYMHVMVDDYYYGVIIPECVKRVERRKEWKAS